MIDFVLAQKADKLTLKIVGIDRSRRRKPKLRGK
jgi:hypothetical protein